MSTCNKVFPSTEQSDSTTDLLNAKPKMMMSTGRVNPPPPIPAAEARVVLRNNTTEPEIELSNGGISFLPLACFGEIIVGQCIIYWFCVMLIVDNNVVGNHKTRLIRRKRLMMPWDGI
jgi:hypothetical protein